MKTQHDELDGRHGAYGLRLAGVNAPESLVAAGADWPRLEVRTLRQAVTDVPERVEDDFALLRLRTGGQITIDRIAGVATYRLPRALGDEELVHPFLAPAAAMMSYWLGRSAVHAGAILVGDKVWGVLGERTAGKSSLLAWLTLAGAEVFTDDLLVIEIEALSAFAGPRSIDLRSDSAERLDLGVQLGVLGTRERWRVRLGPVRATAPLAGWIFLTWDDRVSLHSVAGSEWMARIAAQSAVTLPPRDPLALLELASLPCLELRRPRDWAELESAGNLLLAALGR